MQHFLGIDIGTSGAKAVLIDEKGRIKESVIEEYPLYSPHPLWSEQEPGDWWLAVVAAIKGIVSMCSTESKSITAIGLTGQMHGAVYLDAKDKVIRRALLWNDQRTAEECNWITNQIGANRLIELTGNPALTGFQAPKIIWLREHEPEKYAQVTKVLLPKDFIRLKLTGEYATDCSDAAGTLLLDLRKRDWSSEVLSKLNIPREWLPKVYEGSQVTGKLLASVGEELGLPAGIPVIAGGGDNAAAAIGTGIVKSGLVSSSIGTSGVIFAHSDAISLDPQGRLHSFCHAVPGRNHLMAVTLSAGNSLRWLRDIYRSAVNDLGGVSAAGLNYDVMAAEAEKVPVGSEGLVFLPYLNGERTPLLDPLATGAFIGLTSRHTCAHMIRAVMEGVVFSLLDGLQIMRDLNVPITQVRAIGGGGKSPFWCQMQADVFDCEVVNLEVEEGPAYGAALLAIAADQDAAGVTAISEANVKTRKKRNPDQTNHHRYMENYQIYSALYGELKKSMHQLSNLAVK